MQISKILFAVLPALALAEDGRSTTTCTATTTLTKTMTLSQVHTVISSQYNTTTPVATTTAADTSFSSAPVVTTTAVDEKPPVVTDKPGAGSALDASRVVLAGALGMVVVAMI